MPVFQVKLEFDDKGAVKAVSSFNSISKAAESVTRNFGGIGRSGGAAFREVGDAARDASSQVYAYAKQLAGLLGVYKALGAAKGFIQRGVEFNSQIETAKIGMASLISSQMKLAKAGEDVELAGPEKYKAAKLMADELVGEIQKLGLETVATTQELVGGVQTVMGAALKAGLDLKQIPQFAVNAAQAMQTMGIPLVQMRTEIEALLTGNINKAQDLLAPRLGVTRQLVEEWTKAGTLFDNLMKRMEFFKVAGADIAQTWTGLVSNLSEAMDVVAGDAAEGFTKKMKEGVSALQSFFIETGGGTPKISEKFDDVAETLNKLEDALGGAVKSAIDGVIASLGWLDEKIESLGGASGAVDTLKTAVTGLGAALVTLMGVRRTQAAMQNVSIGGAAQETAALNAEAGAAAAATGANASHAASLNGVSLASLRASASELQQARTELQLAAAAKQAAISEEALANAANRLAAAEARAAKASAAFKAQLAGLRSAAAAASGVTALSKAFGGLVAGLGGPWGIALTALTTAISMFAVSSGDAASASDKFKAAQQELEGVLNKTKDACGNAARAMTDLEKAEARAARRKMAEAYREDLANAKKEMEGFLNYMREARSSEGAFSLSDAMFGAGGGSKHVNASRELVDETEDLAEAFTAGTLNAQQFAEGLSGVTQKAHEGTAADREFGDSIDGLLAKDGIINVLAGMEARLEGVGASARNAAADIQTLKNTLAGVDMAGAGLIAAANDAVATAKMKSFEKTIYSASGRDKTLNLVSPEFRQAVAKNDSKSVKALLAGEQDDARWLQMMQFSQTGAEAYRKFAQAEKDAEDFRKQNRRGGGGGGKKGRSGRVEKASDALQTLRNEISTLNGITVADTLEKKLKSIDKAAKEAGVSASELKQEYTAAFQKNLMKDFDKALFQARDETQKLKEIEIADTVDQWRAKFEDANIPVEQYKNRLEELRGALERQARIEGLEKQLDAMTKVAEVTGDYTMALQIQNRLIDDQASKLMNIPGMTKQAVDEWARYQKLLVSRDPVDGLRLAVIKASDENMNAAKAMESLWTDTMGGMSDALVNFVKTGKLSFEDLANSFIEQVARMVMQAAVSGLFNFVGGLFGGQTATLGGALAGQGAVPVIGTGGGYSIHAAGGAFSGISGFSNSIVTRPTLFSYGSQLTKFAKGGVMGEAGPEAVMPLTRMSNGRLGVQADGAGSAPVVNVNVYNENRDTQVETRSRTNRDGGIDIDMYIKRVVAGDIARGNGPIDQSIRNSYGAKRIQRGV